MSPHRLPASLLALLWLALGLAVAVALVLTSPVSVSPRPAAALPHQPVMPPVSSPQWSLELEDQGLIPQPTEAPAAHASNLLALPHDSSYAVAAFWFAGSKEAAPDVGIVMSLWSRSENAWTPPVRVVDRIDAGAALGKGISRIGNPVAWIDQQQRLHLFVVGTGLGGWASSRVLHLRQDNAQADLDPLQPGLKVIEQLPLSWLWNLSHLVRHAPLALADGGMVLPLYFEMGAKYPVFAWFSPNGEFLGMRRFTGIKQALQPSILAVDDQNWIALLRTQTSHGHIGVLSSKDSGLHWTQQAALTLSNDDSAIAGIKLPDGRFVMVRNPAETGRSQLLMHLSQDGLNWTEPQTLVNGSANSEYSYPALSWADDRLWLSYTHLRQGIAWQRWRLRPLAQGKP